MPEPSVALIANAPEQSLFTIRSDFGRCCLSAVSRGHGHVCYAFVARVQLSSILTLCFVLPLRKAASKRSTTSFRNVIVSTMAYGRVLHRTDIKGPPIYNLVYCSCPTRVQEVNRLRCGPCALRVLQFNTIKQSIRSCEAYGPSKSLDASNQSRHIDTSVVQSMHTPMCMYVCLSSSRLICRHSAAWTELYC